MNHDDDFIGDLCRALGETPLRETVLLAPSHRVGRQWLDRAASRLGGLANVRVATLSRLTLDLAETRLRPQGLRVASRPERLRIIGRLLERLRARDSYFSAIPASRGFAEMVLSAVEEVETVAGQSVPRLRGLEEAGKAGDLSELFREYAAVKQAGHMAGAAEVHAAAIEALSLVQSQDSAPGFVPSQCPPGPVFRESESQNLKSDRTPGPGQAPLLLVPADLLDDLNPNERDVVRRWPGDCLRVLRSEKGEIQAELSLFTASTPLNEAREILRRIQEMATPLDRVEVVAVDPRTSIPALCAAGVEAFGGRVEDLPITFTGGIPVMLTRPGRALAAWADWLAGGLAPEGLARMLQSGLLGGGWLKAAGAGAGVGLAARLRELPIHGQPKEYLRQLGAGEGSAPLAAAEADLTRLLERIVPGGLSGETPDLSDSEGVLRAACELLRETGRRDGKLDAYAASGLLAAVEQWLLFADWEGFEALAWLGELAGSIRVMGLGPLPGRLHVGELFAGGHSGRDVTFVMGLDDSRFPGGVRQDPVLLDKERALLSPRLAVSGRMRDRRARALELLLGRVRGRLFLSHARADGGSSRELFPSEVFTRLARQTNGIAGANEFSPGAGGKNLSAREDWLAALTAGGDSRPGMDALTPRFPWLEKGRDAARLRMSSRFTEYDGNVPEAGTLFCGPDCERAVSPTDLELFAACPMDFFFKRVLGIRPPERYRPAAGQWLDGNVRGTLLHDLFQDYLTIAGGSGAGGDLPEEGLLLELLHKALGRYRKRYPPRDEIAYRRERRDLEEACAIFLATESARRREGRSLYMEVALGGQEQPQTPWDREEPLAYLSPAGTIRLRGRVDRIDRLHRGGLVIIDYKTGRSAKYSPADPFLQGRHLQPYLYAWMLEQARAEAGIPEPVTGFTYFFPMPRDEGRSVHYPRAELEKEGGAVMDILVTLLAAGCFPFTTVAADVAFSEYLPLYTDADALAAAARDKALAEPILAPWARLRGLVREAE